MDAGLLWVLYMLSQVIVNVIVHPAKCESLRLHTYMLVRIWGLGFRV